MQLTAPKQADQESFTLTTKTRMALHQHLRNPDKEIEDVASLVLTDPIVAGAQAMKLKKDSLHINGRRHFLMKHYEALIKQKAAKKALPQGASIASLSESDRKYYSF